MRNFERNFGGLVALLCLLLSAYFIEPLSVVVQRSWGANAPIVMASFIGLVLIIVANLVARWLRNQSNIYDESKADHDHRTRSSLFDTPLQNT